MPTKLYVAEGFSFRNCNQQGRIGISYGRKLFSRKMATPMVVPILRRAKYVVHVSVTNVAKSIEYFVFQRLDDWFHMCLKIGRHWRDAFHVATS